MEIDELLQVVDVAFQCPDAKEIDDGYSEKDGKPNGSKALSKQKAEAIMKSEIMKVIQRSCKDDFTKEGPMGGHAMDPVKANPDLSDPQSLDKTIHDEETLAREIGKADPRY